MYGGLSWLIQSSNNNESDLIMNVVFGFNKTPGITHQYILSFLGL